MIAANSPMGDDTEMVVPDFAIESLARCLLPKMQAYFASEEGQRHLKSGSVSEKKMLNRLLKRMLN